MKEAFEKIRFRLQDHCESGDCRKFCHECDFKTALRIVDEVEAEYGNGCEKQTYEICLNGCDDDTTFKMDLTESEYQFLLRVSELANETSTYGCMPRLYVEPYKPEKGV